MSGLTASVPPGNLLEMQILGPHTRHSGSVLWECDQDSFDLTGTPIDSDSRRSNQSILKEISPGISLEGMMLKLKLQYFGHLMRRVDLLEKTLMLGGIGGRRRRG